MKKIIYANKEHEVIVSNYITMIKEFVKDVSNDVRWKNYNQVYDLIVEYHNNYGKSTKENNYWDWLMIIPINVSVMTQGYFAGIETKKNSATIRAYRLVLAEMLEQLINKIEKLEPTDE